MRLLSAFLCLFLPLLYAQVPWAVPRAIQHLSSPKDLSSFINDNEKSTSDIAVVAYLGPRATQLGKLFVEVAFRLQQADQGDFRFGQIDSAKLSNHSGHADEVVIYDPALFKEKDPPHVMNQSKGYIYHGSHDDTEALERFIWGRSAPLIGEFSPERYARYSATKKVLFYSRSTPLTLILSPHF